MTKGKNAIGALMVLGHCWRRSQSASVSCRRNDQHNDIGRTGNSQRTILTLRSKCGPVREDFGAAGGGQVYAQPLYLSNISIRCAIHNVVYGRHTIRPGSTRSMRIQMSAGNSAPLWQVSLLDAAHGASNGAVNYEGFGVNSTPVIDPVSKRCLWLRQVSRAANRLQTTCLD